MLLLFLIIILGIISTFTDIKYMKVYNKHLLIFLIIGTILHFFNCVLKIHTFNFMQIINIFISIVVGYLMYYFNIWGAGDAKLFSIFIYLLPYDFYRAKHYEIFPAFIILSYIFFSAFIYIIIETMIFKFQKKNSLENIFIKKNFSSSKTTHIIISYLSLVNLIYFLDNLFIFALGKAYIDNKSLILILNIFIIFFIISKPIPFRIILINFIIMLFMNTISTTFSITKISLNVNIYNLLIIIFIYYLRSEALKYNYKPVSINNIKPGMILSYQTINMFFKSKIKNLPHHTDETTNYRISFEEVKAIKKWGEKNHSKCIIIVNHIPFAPFIFFGLLIFIFIKIFTR